MKKLYPVNAHFKDIHFDTEVCLLFFNSSALSDADLPILANNQLSAQEKLTFEKRKQLIAKKEFIVSRVMIKQSVAQLFGLDHRQLNVFFDQQESCLKVLFNHQPLPIQVCISHSHGNVIVALSRTSTKLGIDLEICKPTRPWLKLARHFYHPDEISQIEEQGVARFYRTWTLKEALAKAIKEPIAKLLSQNIYQQLEQFTVISGNYQDLDISLITDIQLNNVELNLVNQLFSDH